MGDLPSMLVRLFVAVLLASVFGWERERKTRPAGLRTHILVCVGSTLLTMVSESYARPNNAFPSSDPSRISAQIVSGIGFLGAGTIFVRGSVVRGLTTAASLWVAAAIGIAVGRGGDFFAVATVTSLIVLFVLTVVDRLEDRLIRKKAWREVTVSYAIGAGSDAELATLFGELGLRIRSVERLHDPDANLHRTVFDVELPPKVKASAVNASLLQLPWVRRTEWDS